MTDIKTMPWRRAASDPKVVWAVDPRTGASIIRVGEYATERDAEDVVRAHNDALDATR